MAKQIEISEIKVNEFYGIQTWGGASSGLWLIAKVVSVGNVFCSYEIQNGAKIEKRRCKTTDIFDAKECAKEATRNRPEYANSYQKYI
jgi:hypothetical protein